MGARSAHNLTAKSDAGSRIGEEKHVIRWDKLGSAPLSCLFWKDGQATSSWFFLGNIWLASQVAKSLQKATQPFSASLFPESQMILQKLFFTVDI